MNIDLPHKHKIKCYKDSKQLLQNHYTVKYNFCFTIC